MNELCFKYIFIGYNFYQVLYKKKKKKIKVIKKYLKSQNWTNKLRRREYFRSQRTSSLAHTDIPMGETRGKDVSHCV
jgi:hypothetical protein